MLVISKVVASALKAQADPTEAPAAAFNTADEKLAELESETADLDDEVKQLTQELAEKTKELDAANAAEGRQQEAVDTAYEAWSQAWNALPDGALYTDVTPTSDYGRANYGD